MVAGARAALWTEGETGASGKVLTPPGITAGTEVRAEIEAEWRSGDAEPSASRDPAAGPEQQGLQARGTGQSQQAAIPPVSSTLAETVAPMLAKPSGLLSKAVWTKSFSSSSPKTSAPPTKASVLPPSSTLSPANNAEAQTVAASSVPQVNVSSSSSASNGNSHWGKTLSGPTVRTHVLASLRHLIAIASTRGHAKSCIERVEKT